MSPTHPLFPLATVLPFGCCSDSFKIRSPHSQEQTDNHKNFIMPLPSSNPFDDYADDKRSLADQSNKLYWRKGELLVQAKTLPLRELEFKKVEAERIAASKLKTSIRKAKASVRKGKQATMTSFFIKK
jgi:hypothetical protein